MKEIYKKRFLDFNTDVSEKMGEPDVYSVDFIPTPLRNWENRPNLDSCYHTRNAWKKINVILNQIILGRHTGRRSKRPFLLHSFNSFEMYEKKNKQTWSKVTPHLHAILFVHPRTKAKFEDLLLEAPKGICDKQIEDSGVETSPIYVINERIFLMRNGFDMSNSIQSLLFRKPYDLDGIVDYYLGLLENYRPIHPENVFKYDLEEKYDGMDVFRLPSEHDFKKELRENHFMEEQEKSAALKLAAAVS